MGRIVTTPVDLSDRDTGMRTVIARTGISTVTNVVSRYKNASDYEGVHGNANS